MGKKPDRDPDFLARFIVSTERAEASKVGEPERAKRFEEKVKRWLEKYDKEDKDAEGKSS
jgi:hypothetical protein